MHGIINATRLNVRSKPDKHSSKCGVLSKGAMIQITGRRGQWLEFRYIETIAGPDETEPSGPVEGIESAAAVLSGMDREKAPLAPERQLPLQGDATDRKVAQTWNKYGRLLAELCDPIAIDVACAVSTLCVESSGKGFQPSNEGRMVIRFENHKFWKYWGRDNPETFQKHFSYQSGQVWKGHKWRRDGDESWQSFHGNQRKEWQVLDFARTLNNEAALFSISMGAPQIMGFHYGRIGYPTVVALFDDFKIRS